MRKILASFLAAAMVVSAGATMSFAAGTKPNATAAATAVATGIAKTAILTVGGEKYTAEVLKGNTYNAAPTATQLKEELDGVTFYNVETDGRRYDVIVSTSGTNVTLTLSSAVKINDPTAMTLNIMDKDGNSILAGGTPISFSFSGANAGSDNTTVDYTDSSANMYPEMVFECGEDGNPIAMTESGVGVDKDQNEQQGSQSGNTIYFMIKKTDQRFEDDNYWKMRVNKGSNGKYIKAISDVDKNFSSNLVRVDNGQAVQGTSGRHRFIKVELNEIFTDDEYKISLDVTFTPKSKAVDNKNILIDGKRVSDDTQLKIKDFYFYMKNIVRNADNDWKVGIGGLMLSPLSNDWNEVTYFDEDGDLAFMKFFADSDVDKFYAKLSTKWEHADYASYFNDQDAYIFDFTGSPKISATSRCDLQIYNPFVNDDGNETIDPATATIYQVIDGDLFDVTDNFTYEEGDNGDMAYVTRTRFLGTYIICEKPVEEAADVGTPDTDLVPEEPVDQAPVETPADGGKAPANTGKFA